MANAPYIPGYNVGYDYAKEQVRRYWNTVNNYSRRARVPYSGYSGGLGQSKPIIPGWNARYDTRQEQRQRYRQAKRSKQEIKQDKYIQTNVGYIPQYRSYGYRSNDIARQSQQQYQQQQSIQQWRGKLPGGGEDIAQVIRYNAKGRPVEWIGKDGKKHTRRSVDKQRSENRPRGVGTGQFEGMNKDQIEAYLNENYPPNPELEGLTFNPDIPRAGDEFINYMMDQGVVPYFGSNARGVVSGRWTDYLLTRMGLSGSGINPYAEPYSYAEQPMEYPEYYTGGSAYPGYGGGYGGGYYPAYPRYGGGGGGSYSSPGYASSGVQQGQGYAPRTSQVPRWVQSLVNWRI